MSTSFISQPPDTVDSLSARGDVVLAHDPEVAQSYRAAAAEAAQRGPGRVIKSKQPVTPQADALPYIGVASAAAGREIQRLRAQVEAGRRDLQGRHVWTAQGYQVSDPAQLAMRAQLVAEIDAAEAEANRLDGLDEMSIRRWAYEHGVR